MRLTASGVTSGVDKAQPQAAALILVYRLFYSLDLLTMSLECLILYTALVRCQKVVRASIHQDFCCGLGTYTS